MKLSALSDQQLAKALTRQGLTIRIDPFNIRAQSSIAAVAKHFAVLYSEFDVLDDQAFIDFDITIAAPLSARRFFRPQANFSLDGYAPFTPLPYNQAAAFFEWGLNWCIANHAHHYLIIHSAVVERNGQAFILPGTPGSGKSTLCAAMVCSGWRLFSDEMALLSLSDGKLYPVPRPISLKNQSIEIIRHFSDQAIIGPLVHDTLKGTIGHMRPPDASVGLSNTPAYPGKVIFPKYRQGSGTELTPLSKARTLLKLAENSFNYPVLGLSGFKALGTLCDQTDGFEFSYSKLDEAMALFTELAA